MTDVNLLVSGSTGVLDWAGFPDPADLEPSLTATVSEGFASGLRRLCVDVPADAAALRRVLHRAGFRLEGVARAARELGDGRTVDVARYALLDTDPRTGRERFTGVMSSVLPRKRLIAHVLLLDEAGRVGMCETSFKPDFELPGGIVEPYESPRDGAIREMYEELGVTLSPDRVLVVDWLRPYLGWEDAVEVVFGAERLSAAQVASVRPDGHEILALHWLEPEAAVATMTDFGGRRLRSALAAASDGVTRYTEAGSGVP